MTNEEKENEFQPKFKPILDEFKRPHCLTGPCLELRNGVKLFCIHGTQVPDWLIMERHLLTPEKIEKETNAEIRRHMIDLYGAENYLLSRNYKVLDEDTDQFGRPMRLLQLEVPEDPEKLTYVEVVNSTAEQEVQDSNRNLFKESIGNKTMFFNKYYLPVQEDLKPVVLVYKDAKTMEIDDQKSLEATKAGRPQKMTCHNAVASSFGLYGEEYGVDGQIRQGDVLITFKDGSNQKKFRES